MGLLYNQCDGNCDNFTSRPCHAIDDLSYLTVMAQALRFRPVPPSMGTTAQSIVRRARGAERTVRQANHLACYCPCLAKLCGAGKVPREWHSMLLVNKQISMEYEDVLYKKATFHFRSPITLERFLHHFPAHNVGRLRRVSLLVSDIHMTEFYPSNMFDWIPEEASYWNYDPQDFARYEYYHLVAQNYAHWALWERLYALFDTPAKRELVQIGLEFQRYYTSDMGDGTGNPVLDYYLSHTNPQLGEDGNGGFKPFHVVTFANPVREDIEDYNSDFSSNFSEDSDFESEEPTLEALSPQQSAQTEPEPTPSPPDVFNYSQYVDFKVMDMAAVEKYRISGVVPWRWCEEMPFKYGVYHALRNRLETTVSNHELKELLHHLLEDGGLSDAEFDDLLSKVPSITPASDIARWMCGHEH